MTSQTINLELFDGLIDDDDPDANFKRDVVFYTKLDPMSTIERLSRHTNIPVGAIVRYILVKWATSGSEGVMEIGPRVVRQMGDIVREAEGSGEGSSRLEAYRKLAGIVSWLNAIP